MTATKRPDPTPRRKADGAATLERALQRYDALVAAGRPDDEARRLATKGLGREAQKLFALAGGLRAAASPGPAPRFAASLEARLRREMGGNVVPLQAVRKLRAPSWRRAPRFGLAAVAACIAVLAGLLVGSAGSLPGTALYDVKLASEEMQVWVLSGPSEARLRLDLAERRFDEVGKLIEQAQQATGAPGKPVAIALGNVDDPKVVALIQETLRKAEEHIAQAAEILIGAQTKDAVALQQLVDVARQGHAVTVQAVGELPKTGQSAVLSTARSLLQLEVVAETAKAQAPAPKPQPKPSPSPCPSPSPSPSPSPTPGPAASPRPAAEQPQGDASPEPTPTATPDGCPTPSPSPSPGPSSAPEPASAEQSGGSGKSEPSQAPQPPQGAQASSDQSEVEPQAASGDATSARTAYSDRSRCSSVAYFIGGC